VTALGLTCLAMLTCVHVSLSYEVSDTAAGAPVEGDVGAEGWTKTAVRATQTLAMA
jgi:hypothetical protein